jgi:hypothetical protein
MVNFNELLKEGVTPNGFYVLCCLDKDQPVAQLVNFELEMSQLPPEFTDFDQRNITAAGKAFVKKHSPKAKVEVTDEMVKEFRDIFPNQTIPTSGKKAKATPGEIKSQFERFFKHYDYGWNVILNATRQYVDEYERKKPAYAYMRAANWFIVKQESGASVTSDLASYCESIVEDGKNFNDNPKRLHTNVS